MAKTKVKAKPKKTRPSHGERLIEAMEEVLRYFRGEPNGVKAIRVTLTPVQMVIRDLVAARKEAGLSVVEVAAASGLSVAALTRIEQWRVKNPSVDTLTRYARAVGREVRLSVVPAEPPAGGTAAKSA